MDTQTREQLKRDMTVREKLSTDSKAFLHFISLQRNVVVNKKQLKVYWHNQPEHVKDTHRRIFASNNELLWLDIKRWVRELRTQWINYRHRKKYGLR